jgi:hypothetical protein
VIGVLTAETMTTSSAELISSLARPRDGMAEVMDWIVEVMVRVCLKSDSVK